MGIDVMTVSDGSLASIYATLSDFPEATLSIGGVVFSNANKMTLAVGRQLVIYATAGYTYDTCSMGGNQVVLSKRDGRVCLKHIRLKDCYMRDGEMVLVLRADKGHEYRDRILGAMHEEVLA